MGINSNKETLLSSVMSNSIISIINILFPLITIPLITSTLGSEKYGLYASILSFIFLINTFMELGLKMGLIKKVGDGCDINENLYFYLLVKSILTLSVFPIFYIYYENFLWGYFALSFLMIDVSWYYQSSSKMKRFMHFSFLSKISAIPVFLYFYYTGGDINDFLFSYSISWFVLGLICFFDVFKNLESRFIRKMILSDMLSTLLMSFKFYIFRLPNTIYMSSSVFIASFFLTNIDLSLFALSFQIYGIGGAFIGAISISLFSRKGQFDYGKVAILTSICVLFFFPIYYLCATHLVPIVFGLDFQEAKGLILLFYISTCFQVFGSILGYPYLNSISKINVAHNTMLFSSIGFFLFVFLCSFFSHLSSYHFVFAIIFADFLLAATRGGYFLLNKRGRLKL
ncbi:oligosaccharide flippase family protein [Pseudoalteromonas neustonica]|uniref:oligosaccharide flippase family protein n=1 Tax=Pseudoalteromonas neustonica TaxID=1840331 RepID=UPI001648594C|nr:oligosaccharide flippase family protein [Pseudoalteromonas neustonica]